MSSWRIGPPTASATLQTLLQRASSDSLSSSIPVIRKFCILVAWSTSSTLKLSVKKKRIHALPQRCDTSLCYCLDDGKPSCTDWCLYSIGNDLLNVSLFTLETQYSQNFFTFTSAVVPSLPQQVYCNKPKMWAFMQCPRVTAGNSWPECQRSYKSAPEAPKPLALHTQARLAVPHIYARTNPHRSPTFHAQLAPTPPNFTRVQVRRAIIEALDLKEHLLADTGMDVIYLWKVLEMTRTHERLVEETDPWTWACVQQHAWWQEYRKDRNCRIRLLISKLSIFSKCMQEDQNSFRTGALQMLAGILEG